MFLLQDTLPNVEFLQAKFRTADLQVISAEITKVLHGEDIKLLARDLQPFLINEDALGILTNFEVFLNQKL
jgi:hypothetical protein